MNDRVRLAINGYGRIGRCVVRALHESSLRDHMQVVVINEPADLATMEYLTRYDSTHGVFPGHVERDENGLILDSHPITVLHRNTPEAVDWHGMSVDLMLECSGQYSQRADLRRFIDAGCPRVLLSHPGASANDVDRTVVYGINQDTLQPTDTLVSNASCTTNA
ncbi:MAG TPA: glyceraldehyde 3-phosphate dehydrogenase NAD-binding domain-containing protein, partial [Burkholderiaceae bacterium]|nr:glyceraldehyde 3-phosphate dehydrogenase NAD-binding domain-containing protein [Burkholderiaceae bacterium]